MSQVPGDPNQDAREAQTPPFSAIPQTDRQAIQTIYGTSLAGYDPPIFPRSMTFPAEYAEPQGAITRTVMTESPHGRAAVRDSYGSSHRSAVLPTANADLSIIIEAGRRAAAGEDNPQPIKRPEPNQTPPEAVHPSPRNEDRRPVQDPLLDLSPKSKLKRYLDDQRVLQKKLVAEKKGKPVSSELTALFYIREAARRAAVGEEDPPSAQRSLTHAGIPIELDDDTVFVAPRQPATALSELTTPVLDRDSRLSGIEEEMAAMVSGRT